MLPIARHLCALLPLAFCCVAGAAEVTKILRVASPDIDTLDPQQFSDDPSFQVLMAVYEPLYEWDYLASPPKLSPLTATGPLAIHRRRQNVGPRTLNPGYFSPTIPPSRATVASSVAEDYVYSYKRWLDPNLSSGRAPPITDRPHPLACGPLSMPRARAGSSTTIGRSRACVRSIAIRLQLRLVGAELPRSFRDLLGFVGAAAHEVIDAAGGDIRTRAVGTGPFRLRASGSAGRASCSTPIPHTGV